MSNLIWKRGFGICGLFIALILVSLGSTAKTSSVSQRSSVPAVISPVMPAYPVIAAAKRIEGKVFIDVKINSDGQVVTAHLIKGNMALANSAMDAAKRWRFKPVLNSHKLNNARLLFIYHLDKENQKPSFVPPYEMNIYYEPTIDTFAIKN